MWDMVIITRQGRQADRQTDRQTDRGTDRPDRQAGETHSHIDEHSK